MINTQHNEYGSRRSPDCSLQTNDLPERTNAPAMPKGKVVNQMILQLPISREMASGIEA